MSSPFENFQNALQACVFASQHLERLAGTRKWSERCVRTNDDLRTFRSDRDVRNRYLDKLFDELDVVASVARQVFPVARTDRGLEPAWPRFVNGCGFLRDDERQRFSTFGFFISRAHGQFVKSIEHVDLGQRQEG